MNVTNLDDQLAIGANPSRIFVDFCLPSTLLKYNSY